MGYYTDKRKVIETTEGKVVAIATNERGAEIIANLLNHYFKGCYTHNEAVEMMHENTANALDRISSFVQKNEYTAEMIIEYLNRIS